MKQWIKKTALFLARVELFGTLVGAAFEYVSFLLPIARRAENHLAVCFDHPVPATPFHLLAIPKQRVGTIFDLSSQQRSEVFEAVMQCIESALCAEVGRFSITSNFGRRQEVKQVHWHIIREEQNKRKFGRRKTDRQDFVFETDRGVEFRYQTERNDKGVLEVKSARAGSDYQSRDEIIGEIKNAIERKRQYLLGSKGFSLVLEVSKAKNAPVEWPTCFTFFIDQ